MKIVLNAETQSLVLSTVHQKSKSTKFHLYNFDYQLIPQKALYEIEHLVDLSSLKSIGLKLIFKNQTVSLK